MQVQSLGQEDPLEKGMTTTPVFLPGEFHGQRSLVGYSLWSCKQSKPTEATEHTHNRRNEHRTLLLSYISPPHH